jgi:hypothetical protein
MVTHCVCCGELIDQNPVTGDWEDGAGSGSPICPSSEFDDDHHPNVDENGNVIPARVASRRTAARPRYEIRDSQNPSARGMGFNDLERAKKEHAQSVPIERFYVYDRHDKRRVHGSDDNPAGLARCSWCGFMWDPGDPGDPGFSDVCPNCGHVGPAPSEDDRYDQLARLMGEDEFDINKWRLEAPEARRTAANPFDPSQNAFSGDGAGMDQQGMPTSVTAPTTTRPRGGTSDLDGDMQMQQMQQMGQPPTTSGGNMNGMDPAKIGQPPPVRTSSLFPIVCNSCGGRFRTAKITADLHCGCGSDDVDLDLSVEASADDTPKCQFHPDRDAVTRIEHKFSDGTSGGVHYRCHDCSMKYRPGVDGHDVMTRVSSARTAYGHGDKVTVSLPSGREMKGEIRGKGPNGEEVGSFFHLVHDDDDPSESVWEIPEHRIRPRYSSRTAAVPKGRSDYKPGKARVGDPTPQTHPHLFSDEDIMAEVKHLMRTNRQYGSNPIRTMKYMDLMRTVRERGNTTEASLHTAIGVTPKDKGRPRIDIINDVVSGGPFAADGKLHHIDGAALDGMTADLLKQMHGALSPENQAKFDHLPIEKLVDLGWKHVKGLRQGSVHTAQDADTYTTDFRDWSVDELTDELNQWRTIHSDQQFDDPVARDKAAARVHAICNEFYRRGIEIPLRGVEGAFDDVELAGDWPALRKPKCMAPGCNNPATHMVRQAGGSIAACDVHAQAGGRLHPAATPIRSASLHTAIRTADGKEVGEGDRVFDYYDGHWGIIGKIDDAGWFDHIRDEGGRGYLNGDRVAVNVPESNPLYDKWKRGKSAARRTAADSVPLRCMECDRRFRKKVGPSSTPKCPGCGGYDVEPDYERGFPTGYEGSRRTAAIGTGPGYYVLSRGVALAGPYETTVAAHDDLVRVRGDGVMWLADPNEVSGHGDMEPFTHPSGWGGGVENRFGFSGGSPRGSSPYGIGNYEGKVNEIALGLMRTSKLSRSEAERIARQTVERYPKMIRREPEVSRY